jgi:hypothetical protein
MGQLTKEQLAKMKKEFEEDKKESSSTLEKAVAAAKQAEVVKVAAKKTKTELGQETD